MTETQPETPFKDPLPPRPASVSQPPYTGQAPLTGQTEGTPAPVEPRMILCVAEKPDAAKFIANSLRGGFALDNYYPKDAFPVHTTLKEINGELVKMSFTSTGGHLLRLLTPDKIRPWKFNTNPIFFEIDPELGPFSSSEPIVAALRSLAPNASELQLWLDNDMEGECISEEVRSICIDANPGLTYKRIRFSALTKTEIINALKAPTQLNYGLVNAAKYRAQIDFRTGHAFSRIQSLFFRSLFPFQDDRIVAYGTCILPTVHIVLTAFRKYQLSLAQSLLNLSENSSDFSQNSPDSSKKPPNFSQNSSAQNAYQRRKQKQKKKDVIYTVHAELVYNDWIITPYSSDCFEARPPFRYTLQWDKTAHDRNLVEAIAGSLLLDTRPFVREVIPFGDQIGIHFAPLTTTRFLQLSSTLLGLESFRSMEIAEWLYTNGFISYPRTETAVFPASINLGEICAWLLNFKELKEAVPTYSFRFKAPTNKCSASDHAHAPIYPLRPGTSLTGDDLRVYLLICRCFLATCSPSAKYHLERVFFTVSHESFSLVGCRFTRRGWTAFIPATGLPQNLPILPEFEVYGPDPVGCENIGVKRVKKGPKKLLNEAELIAKMEKLGIGTDATIAEHIRKVQQLGYVKVNKMGLFEPTELGKALVEAYEGIGVPMAKPHLRREVEKRMEDIIAGVLDYENCVEEAKLRYLRLYEEVKDHSKVLWKKLRLIDPDSLTTDYPSPNRRN